MRRAGILTAAAALALAGAACSSAATSARTTKPVPLRIGLLYTTGGLGGDLAQAVLGAANLATEDAKERSNVAVEIVEADYAGDLASAPSQVASLREKVDAIVVGTNDPDIVPVVSPVEDVAVLHAFVATDGIVGGRRNTFRLAPSNEMAARTIAEFLVETRGYEAIGVLTDTTTFGEQGATDLAAAFAQAGATPVLSRSFAPGGDVHTPVMEAAGKGVQALVVWSDSPSEASRIVVEAHRVGQSYQIVLSGNLATSTFAKNASAQVTPVAFRDGMLSVGTWAGPWFELERIVGFYRDFQTANSALAPPQATAVYDSILALAAAARAQGTATADLIGGLEALDDFEGSGVPVSFSAEDHEGIGRDDMAMLGFTKDQDSAGGEFFPEVDTGGGFFTVVSESLRLPPRYRWLANV